MSDPHLSYINGYLMESLNWQQTKTTGITEAQVSNAAKSAADATARQVTQYYEGLLAHEKEGRRLANEAHIASLNHKDSIIKLKDTTIEGKDIALEGKDIEIRKKEGELKIKEGERMGEHAKTLYAEAMIKGKQIEIIDLKEELKKHRSSESNYADQVKCLVAAIEAEIEAEAAKKIIHIAKLNSDSGLVYRRYTGYPEHNRPPLLL